MGLFVSKPTTLMEQENNKNPQEPAKPELAIGELTHKDAAYFMSVYISAIRVLGAIYAKKGTEEAIRSAYTMFAKNMLLLDPTIVGTENYEKSVNNAKISCIAIGQALATSMTHNNPSSWAYLCDTALECVDTIYKEHGDSIANMHLNFITRSGEKGLLVSVTGSSVEEVSARAAEIMADKITPDNVIKMNNNKK